MSIPPTESRKKKQGRLLKMRKLVQDLVALQHNLSFPRVVCTAALFESFGKAEWTIAVDAVVDDQRNILAKNLRTIQQSRGKTNIRKLVLYNVQADRWLASL